MPLRLTRRAGSSAWWITGTVSGSRIRQSAGTSDRAIAEEARAALEARLHREAIYGPSSVVTWKEAVRSYIEVNPPSAGTAALLVRLTSHLGARPLKDIGQSEVDRACAALCRPGAAAATRLRNVISPLRAVLTHAARRGWCDLPAFETPKGATGIRRTRWLTPAEFVALRAAAAPHLRPLLVVLVCTGARLSEALALAWADVDLDHGRAVLRDTKNRRDRLVDLPPAAVAALASLPRRDGVVFRTPRGTPYADHGRRYGGQVGSAFAGAVTRAGLAGDVTPHTLRHTWASWHYCVHRDLLRLKADGDWSSVVLVERYAKLTPESMRPAVLAVWGMGAQRETMRA